MIATGPQAIVHQGQWRGRWTTEREGRTDYCRGGGGVRDKVADEAGGGCPSGDDARIRSSGVVQENHVEARAGERVRATALNEFLAVDETVARAHGRGKCADPSASDVDFDGEDDVGAVRALDGLEEVLHDPVGLLCEVKMRRVRISA